MTLLPERLWLPHEPFALPFADRHAEGLERLRHSSVAIVGLARNCGPQLADNLQRLHGLASMCKSWQMHIESNDCDDDTLDVLGSQAVARLPWLSTGPPASGGCVRVPKMPTTSW